VSGRIAGKYLRAGGTALCAVVVRERVVAPEALPTGKLAGVKVAVVNGGKFDAEKLTATGRVPPCVAKFIANIAVCPAVTVTGCVGPVMEKLSIAKLSELDVPPPGVGFETVITAVPTAASELEATVAVSVVPPFVTVPA
jgi:hypothetical protein